MNGLHKPGDQFVHNAWCVIAWSHEVQAGDLFSRRVAGEWTGDPRGADPSQIPDTFSLDSPAWRYEPAYLHYQADQLLIADNVLDFSHLSYVHEKTLGGSAAIAGARPRVESPPNGIRIHREVTNTAPSPLHRSLGMPDGEADRWWTYDYTIPGILLLESGVRPANGAEGRRLHFHSCQAVVPESATTSHYVDVGEQRIDRAVSLAGLRAGKPGLLAQHRRQRVRVHPEMLLQIEDDQRRVAGSLEIQGGEMPGPLAVPRATACGNPALTPRCPSRKVAESTRSGHFVQPFFFANAAAPAAGSSDTVPRRARGRAHPACPGRSPARRLGP